MENDGKQSVLRAQIDSGAIVDFCLWPFVRNGERQDVRLVKGEICSKPTQWAHRLQHIG